jgi:hypothetical protein
MKIAFTLGNVPITVYDDSAVGHEEEIADLFEEYNHLDEQLFAEETSEEQQDAICDRCEEIRGKLGTYGYRHVNGEFE